MSEWTSTVTDGTVVVVVNPGSSSRVQQTILTKGSYYATATTDFPVSILANKYGSDLLAMFSNGSSFAATVFLKEEGAFSGEAAIVGAEWNTTRTRLYKNGVAVESGSGLTVSTNARPWTIGRAAHESGGGVGNSFLYGDICELLFFTTSLTDEEHELLSDYLTEKWIGDEEADSLTGSEVTSSAGTVTASTSISIDGEQVTTATGTLIPAGSTAIIGDEVIVAGGGVTGNVTVALSGAEVTAYAGSVSPSGTDSAGLVGSEVTASAGALVSSISIALNGADVSAVAGAIGIAMAISGEQVNVDSGSLAAAIESAIGGDIVAANSGALTANTEVSITGSEVEAYSGTVSTSMEDAELLTGSEVTCSAGNMVGHVTIALTGSQVTVYAGSLQKPRGAAIRGVVVTQKIEHAVVLGAVTGTTVTQLSRGTHVTS